ncbi:aldehyde dehydrogenase family protein [Bdellovibrionota bacterium FG-1]
MTIQRHRNWIGGSWQSSQNSGDLREIHSPFDRTVVSVVEYASSEQMQKALAAAAGASGAFKKISRYARSRLLAAMREGIATRRDDFVRSMVLEAGKPTTLAHAEVTRALTTFTVAAEEAKRFGGEVIPIDIDATARAYAPAISFWVPRGPILGITPFNFPLNLVAHKVAPALAVGAPILIKAAPQTPGGATLLAEVFEKALAQVQASEVGKDLIPAAALQVIHCSNEVTGLAVTDPRITTVSFTGSVKVGWMLQQKAIGKRLTLELGGNAGVVIHSDADLKRAANRCVAGAFGYAGQSCISVQRIFVQNSVKKKFEELLLSETRKTAVGDPTKKETIVGPVIDSGAADRIMNWIGEAQKSGAQVLCGGSREGNVIAPTLLSQVPRSLPLVCEEVFGPVAVIEGYELFEDAIAGMNDSRFGLQAGIFTDSARLIRQAIDEFEVGGVMVNEVPTYRADQMPYGGVKESGLGREGVRYAMEEYSERRTVVTWTG